MPDNLMIFDVGASELEKLSRHVTDAALKAKLLSTRNHGEYLAKGQYPTGRYRLSLTSDEAAAIIEVAGSLLHESGITDGEINGFGLEMERVIDIFSGRKSP